MIRRYATLEHFHAADSRRADSVQVEFGGAWRTDDSAKGSWCAIWLEDTGELIVVKQRFAPGGRIYLGAVQLLATGLAELEDVQELLDGWRDHNGSLFSLRWLRERCASFVRVAQEA